MTVGGEGGWGKKQGRRGLKKVGGRERKGEEVERDERRERERESSSKLNIWMDKMANMCGANAKGF